MITQLDPDRTYRVGDIFAGLRYPVRGGHAFFVASPPAPLSLDVAQLQALEVRAPFFVDHGWSFGPSAELVPFVFDRASGGQPRFSEAESLTDYDAGSFGLAAVSAPTAEDQGRLYRALAQAIVDVHRANRDLMEEWLEAQGDSSRHAFVYFDEEREPAVEKLLAPNGGIDRTLWDARLEELTQCIARDSFHKHHFRWVEFLAHSVDMPRLVDLIIAAQ